MLKPPLWKDRVLWALCILTVALGENHESWRPSDDVAESKGSFKTKVFLGNDDV